MRPVTVAVTAGHSNRDPGAVYDGAKEAELARELRNIVASKLRLKGVTVLTDGDGADNLPLSDAVKLIRKAALGVEIHFNASTNTSARGVECLGLPEHKALCQALSCAVARVTKDRLRGDNGFRLQEESARGKLAVVDAGGLILEVCFGTHRDSLVAYQSVRWLVASAIADVVEEYLNDHFAVHP